MLEAKIVTADGRIVIANEYQNEDLFYAMRGGGFGFGVVVSLTVRYAMLVPILHKTIGLECSIHFIFSFVVEPTPCLNLEEFLGQFRQKPIQPEKSF